MRILTRFLAPTLAFGLLTLIPLFGLDPERQIYVQCAASLGIYLWILISWRSSTLLKLDPYILFVTATFLFNAGQTVLYLFGGIAGLLNGRFSNDTLIDTLTMVNYYLVALHAGAVASQRSRHVIRSPLTQLSEGRICATAVGWIFLGVSLPFALIELAQSIARVYTQGSLSAIYQSTRITGADAAPTLIMQFLIPGALFLLAGSRRNSRQKWIALSLIAAYTFVQFFLGVRGMAVVVLASTAWLWNKMIRKLPAGLMLLGIFALTVLLPIIAITRNSSGADRLNAGALQDAYSRINNPTINLLNEMGTSMAVNAWIVELVPDDRPFDRGVSYLYAASTLLPNIFWEVHPGAANSPSKWLMEKVDPIGAEQGESFAFTVFAEAYMNFGLLGGMIPIALLGVLLARVTGWTDRTSDPGSNALVAVGLCFILLYARGELGNVIRGLGWNGFIPYLLYRYLTAQRKRAGTVPGSTGGWRPGLRLRTLGVRTHP